MLTSPSGRTEPRAETPGLPRETFQSRLARSWALLDSAAPSLGTLPEALRRRAVALLGLAPGDDFAVAGGRSLLNADGSPLQICWSGDCFGKRPRILADPASHIAESGARYQRARAALDAALASTGSAALRPLVERLLFHCGPKGAAEASCFPAGVFWIGASLKDPGCAVYVDGTAFAMQWAWERAEALLQDILPADHERTLLLRALRSQVILASVGLEGSSPKRARLKLYLRYKTPSSFQNPGIRLMESPALRQALALLLQDRSVRTSGFFLGLGFDLASGLLSDFKVDVAGDQLGYTREQWTSLLPRLEARLGVRAALAGECLAATNARISFVGIGTDSNNDMRLNLYLKPGTHEDTAT